MNLWIRSQDKMNLVKVRQVSVNYQNNKQIIANYTPELYENSGEFVELLGIYKTKERALEVLDEIQYKIKNMYILENCKLPKNSCIEQRLAMDDFNIYEMPEK